MGVMPLFLAVMGAVAVQAAGPAVPAAGSGPYARIAVLRPKDGQTTEFEAGYARHLAWHRDAHDAWAWYGWTVWAGERNRWFVYATFGHSSAALDNPVSPSDDERDNLLNVAPHTEYLGNAVYEYLPALSRGTGAPRPAPRLELTTLDLLAGAAPGFEKAIAGSQPSLTGEELWYRLVAGGVVPRYVRLRPGPSLAVLLDGRTTPPLPEKVQGLIARTTVEILTLRPGLSLGLEPSP
jgi:hypothetical protein